MDSGTRISRSYWKSLKLDLKGDRDVKGRGEGISLICDVQRVSSLQAPEAVETSNEIPTKYLKGIKVSCAKKAIQPTAHLKCIYTNACSMGHKMRSWNLLCN